MKYDKNELAVFALIAISLISLLLYSFGDGTDNNNSSNAFETDWADPIVQGEGMIIELPPIIISLQIICN